MKNFKPYQEAFVLSKLKKKGKTISYDCQMVRVLGYAGRPEDRAWTVQELKKPFILYTVRDRYLFGKQDDLVKFVNKETRFPSFISRFSLKVEYNIGGCALGTGMYPDGMKVTLRAYPYPGYRFVKWSDGVVTQERTVTVSEDHTYRAVFIKQYRVEASIVPIEGGMVTGVGLVDEGKKVRLSASAFDGYRFAFWGDGFRYPDREIVVSSDVQLKVNFMRQYQVGIFASEGGQVTPSGVNLCDTWTYLEISAIPNEGYHFVSWSDGSEEPNRLIYIDSDKSITAQFSSDSI